MPKIQTVASSEDPPKDTPISSSDRTLRILTIISFPLSFILLIPHGVETRMVCPALGLVPMSLSAAIGLVHVYRRISTGRFDEKIDAFIAVFLMSILIPSWVFLAARGRAWYWAPNLALLGAYGTMPMIVSL